VGEDAVDRLLIVVERLLARVRPALAAEPDLEAVEPTTAVGDRVVPIRLWSGRP
jgi:hypothetical protein